VSAPGYISKTINDFYISEISETCKHLDILMEYNPPDTDDGDSSACFISIISE